MNKTIIPFFSGFFIILLLISSVADAVEIEVVSIPAGSFVMGSSFSSARDEKPAHKVHVAAFKIMKYEVTQALYHSVMMVNPSQFKGDHLPVERVSWMDVQKFIQQLNRKSGVHYRLPSEAEWEYAARAGSQRRYGWSGGRDKAYLYAWFEEGSNERTHRVGQKRANAFGLHDMHGNVWEWVRDCWIDNYEGAPSHGEAWKSGDCNKRVLRGGSWDNYPNYLVSAYRTWFSKGARYSNLGIRLVQD